MHVKPNVTTLTANSNKKYLARYNTGFVADVSSQHEIGTTAFHTPQDTYGQDRKCNETRHNTSILPVKNVISNF